MIYALDNHNFRRVIMHLLPVRSRKADKRNTLSETPLDESAMSGTKISEMVSEGDVSKDININMEVDK